MPISITELLPKQNTSEAAVILDDLIQKMSICPPANLSTQHSEYFYDHYRQQLAGSQYTPEKIMLIKAQVEIALMPVTQQLFPPLTVVDLFTTPMSEKQQRSISQTRYLLSKALGFACTSVGNCSDRAAYSAIKLFEIFRSTDVKVSLVSVPSVDHFIVYIGNKERGWHIYDPLTNPTIAFTIDEYKAQVLPLFETVATPKDKFEMVLKLPILTLFSENEVQASHLIRDSIISNTPEKLMNDRNYRAWGVMKGIGDLRQKTIDAYDEMGNIFNTVTSSIPCERERRIR